MSINILVLISSAIFWIMNGSNRYLDNTDY